MTVAAPKVRTVPLMEHFGPVIQGEGYLAGLPTLFLRFGLCDFRCSWCDSKFAVEPEIVKRDARRIPVGELIDEVKALSTTPGMWITLSGGNPAMHDLDDFVTDAHQSGYRVSVETQGSIWRPWLAQVDHLTISPKPPSSGMVNPKNSRQLERFLSMAFDLMPHTRRSLKIVVFDEEDYQWARGIILREPREALWQTFLSVGTPTVSEWDSEVVKGTSDTAVRDQVGDGYRWLCERVTADPAMVNVRVLPQLHVIAFGHLRGV